MSANKTPADRPGIEMLKAKRDRLGNRMWLLAGYVFLVAPTQTLLVVVQPFVDGHSWEWSFYLGLVSIWVTWMAAKLFFRLWEARDRVAAQIPEPPERPVPPYRAPTYDNPLRDPLAVGSSPYIY
ncbi:hypothetical protein [Herbidospora mongoliensis]|uniref:hypothetical protein n=1 Tax=Herbidospora mongoliensis TaxID=688067 RepID=UPI000AE8BD39|nr:hypothetical protein [Herbidospora mongoliensis]